MRLPFVVALACVLAVVLSSACGGHQSISPQQCEDACGGPPNVCSYAGGSGPQSAADGDCICRDVHGDCPNEGPGDGGGE